MVHIIMSRCDRPRLANPKHIRGVLRGEESILAVELEHQALYLAHVLLHLLPSEAELAGALLSTAH